MADAWRPTSDLEHRLQETVRAGDQESYFRLIADSELVVPVPPDLVDGMLAGEAQPPWPTQEEDGRVHVLVYTSASAMRACLGPSYQHFMTVRFGEIAETWPDNRWWLAIDAPGAGVRAALPIEARLPSWFVRQVAEGDGRPPQVGRASAPWEELREQHRELPRESPRSEFQPANDVERELLRAAAGNDHDLFLQTLAATEVLLPVPDETDYSMRPGRPGFPWQTREVDGSTVVPAFTSPERLIEAARAAGTGTEYIKLPFTVALRYWPDHEWLLAINSGSPAGGTILAQQLPGLATWADQRAAQRMTSGFEPQNEVEGRLFEAARRRDTDAFLKILLGAQVLVPADPDTPWGIVPGDHGFPWRPVPVHGRASIQLFTSLKWMNEAIGSSRFIMPTLLDMVSAWPDTEWDLVLNPGTPIDATLPGDKVRALGGPPDAPAVPGAESAPSQNAAESGHPTAPPDASPAGRPSGPGAPFDHGPADHGLPAMQGNQPEPNAAAPGEPGAPPDPRHAQESPGLPAPAGAAGAPPDAGTAAPAPPAAPSGRPSGPTAMPENLAGPGAAAPGEPASPGHRPGGPDTPVAPRPTPAAAPDPTATMGGPPEAGTPAPGEAIAPGERPQGPGAPPDPRPTPAAASDPTATVNGPPETGSAEPSAAAPGGPVWPTPPGEQPQGPGAPPDPRHAPSDATGRTDGGPPDAGTGAPASPGAFSGQPTGPGAPFDHPHGPAAMPGTATPPGMPENLADPNATTPGAPVAPSEQPGRPGAPLDPPHAPAATPDSPEPTETVAGRPEPGTAAPGGPVWPTPPDEQPQGPGAPPDPRHTPAATHDPAGTAGGQPETGMAGPGEPLTPGGPGGESGGPGAPFDPRPDPSGAPGGPPEAGTAAGPAVPARPGGGGGPFDLPHGPSVVPGGTPAGTPGDRPAAPGGPVPPLDPRNAPAGGGGAPAAYGPGAHPSEEAPQGGGAPSGVAGSSGQDGFAPSGPHSGDGGPVLRAVDDPGSAFEPGNRIDQELYDAAQSGDSDAFLRVLLNANVLVPIPGDAPLEVTPVQGEFRWDAALRTESAVQVFTSLVRLREVLPESRFVYADFRELIGVWPREDWAMLLNPGTRIGASLRGDQVLALSEWALRVGLVQARPEVPLPPPRQEAAPQMPPEDLDDRILSPSIMQKVVPHVHVAWYLEQGYDRVGGFVHSTADVSELQTPVQLYEALGLLYEGSSFSPGDDGVYVIRWPAYCPDLYRIPFGGRNEEDLAAWGEAGWVIERPPFVGGGFAPGSAGSIREYKVVSVRLPYGAEMYYLGRDRSERFIAMYDPDRLGWLRPDASAESWNGRTEASQ